MKEKLKKLQQIQFVSPYSRYVAMLPLAELEKKEELARIEAENKKKQLCPTKLEVVSKIGLYECICKHPLPDYKGRISNQERNRHR